MYKNIIKGIPPIVKFSKNLTVHVKFVEKQAFYT